MTPKVATAETLSAPGVKKPGLIFFHSAVSGRCRRMEGFVAQVLQRRRNHDTFKYYTVARERRPDLVEKFGIVAIPTLVVLENSAVTARLEGMSSCGEIESFLAPWLQ